ncbi:MAG: COX15/CtaA family protein [Saprospiraceae bacterium]
MAETPKVVRNWLILGLILIFFQIIIGGVTRLTGSGLSITKWDIVLGTFPPFGEVAWHHVFDLYKATPQYQKINEGMTLGEFQFIYFWEYLHRLWARSMGIIFLVPFILFSSKGWINRQLRKRLGLVVLFAALAATLGWIMVASGLINRPWVNAYKLALHLIVAILVFGTLLLAILEVQYSNRPKIKDRKQKLGFAVLSLLFIQVFVGGMMSGMKAGLFFPTWPDMNGEFIPAFLLDGDNWLLQHVNDYDKHPFMAGLVQFLHRSLAYTIGICVSILAYRTMVNSKDVVLRTSSKYMFILMLIQVVLGIITVLNCTGHIPVLWGVLHQAGAILLFGSGICTYFLLTHDGIITPKSI